MLKIKIQFLTQVYSDNLYMMGDEKIITKRQTLPTCVHKQ